MRGEAGATAIEYALIIAGIAVAILASLALLGSNLIGGFGDAEAGLGTPGQAAPDDPCSGYTAVGDPSPTCDPATGAWSCPTDQLILTGTEYSCVASLETCAARPLGTRTTVKHTGAGSGSYTTALLDGVADGTVTAAVLGSGSDGTLSFTPAGSLTWTFPAGRRSATVTFTYDVPGICANGAGRISLSAR